MMTAEHYALKTKGKGLQEVQNPGLPYGHASQLLHAQWAERAALCDGLRDSGRKPTRDNEEVRLTRHSHPVGEAHDQANLDWARLLASQVQYYSHGLEARKCAFDDDFIAEDVEEKSVVVERHDDWRWQSDDADEDGANDEGFREHEHAKY